MKRILINTGLILGILIFLLMVGTTSFLNMAPQIGASATGSRLERMKASQNFDEKEGIFKNLIKTEMNISLGDMPSLMIDFFDGKARRPQSTIETVPFSAKEFSGSDQQVQISWFGHSSLLIRLQGLNILTDPVFSSRASMFSFAGPKRFDYDQHMSVEALPQIDLVIISHDHYDHLDYETISKLAGQVERFWVPLGVGAHLELWGVSPEQITEFDWWEEGQLTPELKLAFTPTRHFSGRGISNRFSTLWGSWALIGKEKRIFFSGDSGYFPGFAEIGAKYGPFDLTLMECGAYNELWSQIHMMPEQTVQAHLDLQGKVLLPIHWGKFDLALHPWTEPVKRMKIQAEIDGVEVCTPQVGETILVSDYLPDEKWWEKFVN